MFLINYILKFNNIISNLRILVIILINYITGYKAF